MFEDDPEEERDFRKDAIYLKGREVVELVIRMMELIPDDNEELRMIANEMKVDASLLAVKYAGAAGDHASYDMKMENATLIRKAARELVVQTHSLREFGFEHTEYFQLIRDLVEEYRQLFVDWVATFDPWDYTVIDRWGLFNPPGIGPDDVDPDDLI